MARTEAQEVARINRRRNRFERRWIGAFTKWIDELLVDYTPGDLTVPQEDRGAFQKMASRLYREQTAATVGFNLIDYKQEDEDEELVNAIRRNLAAILAPLLLARSVELTRQTMGTVSAMMNRTNEITEAGSPPIVYRNTLKNYLYNHRLTVAVSNVTWTDETVRYYSITTVKDPLKNSVLESLRLIEAGDVNAARRLNRRVRRLVSLSLSESQRRMIDLIATPLTQSSAIAAARADAEALDVQKKKWKTMGDSVVRPTHITANNQERDKDDFFEVGGFRMQYPADGSQGAPLSEIVNCRCVTSYV
jgi:hypothetical protein